MTRRHVFGGAAVLALAGAAVLVLLGLDLLRWDRALAAQDVRFLAAPTQSPFTAPPTAVPFGVTERLLAASDDLEFRRRLAGFARVRPRVGFADSQRLQTLRAQTQRGLAGLSRTDPAATRRSRAANMIGVIALDESLAPTDREALADLIRGAIDSFRSAVEIDPANADAKLNLEQALRIAKAASLGGDAPSGGRNRGQRAGLGRPGSGY